MKKKKIILLFVCQVSGFSYSSQSKLNDSYKDMGSPTIEVIGIEAPFSEGIEDPSSSMLPINGESAFKSPQDERLKVNDPAFGEQRVSIVEPGAEERSSLSVQVDPKIASNLTSPNQKEEVFQRHADLSSKKFADMVARRKALVGDKEEPSK